MKAEYLDKNLKTLKEVDLPKEVFEVEVSDVLIAQAMRVHLINARQGTRSTKGRSDMHYTGHKVWRQKGTGRARHGDRTANIFVHGAVMHGPKPKYFSASLTRKMRSLSLAGALTKIANEGKIKLIEDIVLKEGQLSSQVQKMADKLKVKNLLIVITGENKLLSNAVGNLKGVKLVTALNLAVSYILSSDMLLFTEKAMESLVARYKIESKPAVVEKVVKTIKKAKK
jgi:large subunit ribosomal protein L4